jgi:drug/metabolite transporter (DMT)-like permease
VITPTITAMLLVSAIIHASWNAILRSGEDRFWSMALMCFVGSLTALPFTFFVVPPSPESWPYLALSAVLQVGYALFLIRSYRNGHLAHVYPIARGSAPLLVTVGAAIFAGELPQYSALAGIALVSAGIVTLMLGTDRPDRFSFMSALMTGVFIAGYMVVDGLGVRAAGNVWGYVAWQATTSGALIMATFLLIRRKFGSFPHGSEATLNITAGVLATMGYCIAVWAMSQSAMGGVSAIRETSILFAALIGTFILKEALSVQKIIGAIFVTAGVISLSFG